MIQNNLKKFESLNSKYKNYKKNETFEYIDNSKSIKITQNNQFFKYGIDSFLISDFFNSHSKIKKDMEKHNNIKLADMCSGTGIVSINTYSNLKNLYDSVDNHVFSFDCFEKQEYFYYLNLKNVIENSLSNFNVYNIDILNNKEIIPFKNKYDYIIINPPYFSNISNIISKTKEKEIAKFWSKDDYDNFFCNAYSVLKNNGEIYMISRIQNIFNIEEVAKKNKLKLKLLQFVSGSQNKSPKLFMCVFKKGAKDGFNILPNKYINI